MSHLKHCVDHPLRLVFEYVLNDQLSALSCENMINDGLTSKNLPRLCVRGLTNFVVETDQTAMVLDRYL